MKFKTLVCLSLITLVASLSPAAHAQTFSVIHTFTGGGDGRNPNAGVTLQGGVLYGSTTFGGGSQGNGTVYEITHVGSGWISTPIVFFPVDGSGGANPEARVVFGPDGHLYGTTEGGGVENAGVVFNLFPPLSICKTAACFWKENILHSFQGPPDDGDNPLHGDLVWDQQGNIYGTTESGGTANVGAVFQLSPGTNTYSVIYNFLGLNDNDGEAPANGLVIDKNGNLFGTTSEGGLNGSGTVFELTYVPGVGWQETILHSFAEGSDGAFPEAGLVLDSSGNLYGATTQGGAGGGTIFELSPSGNGWTFQVLYSIAGPGGMSGPVGSLAMDAAGNLYGNTLSTGNHGAGSVFKLTNTQNGWVYSSLHDFTGSTDGAHPVGNVTIDANGNLYGTAATGGNLQENCLSNGCGVVWMITP